MFGKKLVARVVFPVHSNIGSCRSVPVFGPVRLPVLLEVPTTPRSSVWVKAKRGMKTR